MVTPAAQTEESAVQTEPVGQTRGRIINLRQRDDVAVQDRPQRERKPQVIIAVTALIALAIIVFMYFRSKNVEERQKGRTERTGSRQTGRTDRTQSRQEGRTGRVTVRRVTRGRKNKKAYISMLAEQSRQDFELEKLRLQAELAQAQTANKPNSSAKKSEGFFSSLF